jgi:hypothetical protein
LECHRLDNFQTISSNPAKIQEAFDGPGAFYRESFGEHFIINCMEKVRLAPTGKLATENGDVPLLDYLALSTIKLDGQQEDEEKCSSQLCLYRLPDKSAPDQKRLKPFIYPQNSDQKRSITCLTSYMGRLVAAMKRKFPEFVVVFFKYNEE